MILGLTGRAGCGKDTAGQYLVERHGYRRFAFADVLKTAALHINPIIFDGERLAPLVAVHGMDFVKRHHPEARRFLQELGLAMRGVDPEVWMRPLAELANSTDEHIVVTDVRFVNEAEMVRSLGGRVLRIDRRDAGLSGEAAAHASETPLSLSVIDYAVDNNGSLHTLYEQLEDIIFAMEWENG